MIKLDSGMVPNRVSITLLLVLGGVLQRQSYRTYDHVSSQKVPARGSGVFADGQQGGEHSDGRMTEASEVVEVPGMSHGAVGKSGIGDRALFSGGQHGSLGGRALIGKYFLMISPAGWAERARMTPITSKQDSLPTWMASGEMSS
jgi:hypothetical protein